MLNIQTEDLLRSNLLQLILTKKKKGGCCCWKIMFGRIESANYLIEIMAVGTRNKTSGRPTVFNTSCKGSDISNIKLKFFADSTFKFSNKTYLCLFQMLNCIMI